MGCMKGAVLSVVLALLMGGCGWKLVREVPVQEAMPVATAIAEPMPQAERDISVAELAVAPVVPVTPIHELDQLFSVYYVVGQMSAAQRKDMLVAAGQRHIDEKTVSAALHYVLLLIHDGSDEQLKRAARILDAMVARNDPALEPELAALARLLQGLLKTGAQATVNGAALAQIVMRREEEIEDLKKQINALKSIEKSLYDRDINSPADRK